MTSGASGAYTDAMPTLRLLLISRNIVGAVRTTPFEESIVRGPVTVIRPLLRVVRYVGLFGEYAHVVTHCHDGLGHITMYISIHGARGQILRQRRNAEDGDKSSYLPPHS